MGDVRVAKEFCLVAIEGRNSVKVAVYNLLPAEFVPDVYVNLGGRSTMGSVDRAGGIEHQMPTSKKSSTANHKDQPHNSFAVRGWHRSSGRRIQKRRGRRSSPNELDEFYTTIGSRHF